MGEIEILYKKGNITVEHRTVQDLFIQWNGRGEPKWSKMIQVGLTYIVEKFQPENNLIIRKTSAGSYMVSCQDWVDMPVRLLKNKILK